MAGARCAFVKGVRSRAEPRKLSGSVHCVKSPFAATVRVTVWVSTGHGKNRGNTELILGYLHLKSTPILSPQNCSGLLTIPLALPKKFGPACADLANFLRREDKICRTRVLRYFLGCTDPIGPGTVTRAQPSRRAPAHALLFTSTSRYPAGAAHRLGPLGAPAYRPRGAGGGH